jgi:hypothetical protein
MRAIGAFGFIGAMLLTAGVGQAGDFGRPEKSLRVAETKEPKFCIQVIACGTKDGKRRQYPTPCAARDDGAKDVSPLEGGGSCDEAK